MFYNLFPNLESLMTMTEAAPSLVITPEQLRAHWQGHRALTRRIIAAFPEDQLFTFSVGGMRPFSEMAVELIRMAAPSVRGLVTGEWTRGEAVTAGSRDEILRLWDESTEEIDTLWPRIAPTKFQETMMAFGQYEGPVHSLLMYIIDNEIHHRAQGYVYLRALGVEPAPFWERA